MGAAMVRRLLDAKHAVILYDVNPESLSPFVGEGARIAGSAGQVGDLAKTVFVSVPTPDIVAKVAEEIAGGDAVRRIVDLSTTGPTVSREVARTVAMRGVALVDCPVSGGVAGARKGTLALMAGASQEDIDALRPVLEIFGRVFHVGPEPGMGQMMKVINNLMSAGALAVSAEGATMAVKAGLDPDIVIDVLNAGSGRSSATLDKYPRQILPGTFDAGFAIGLMLKDVRLCLEQARALGLDLPASRAVAGVWEQAAGEIGESEDFTRVVQIAERAAGVSVRSRSATSRSAG
jgi:3-hydroxyisobutyrate dehydrogenase-like beta-hydroxyacid dehydrogenase